MAKSGKGQSAGTAGPRARPRTRQRRLARLEKRLQKARDVEAKRKKQAAEARAEVAQLTAQIKGLRPPTVARSVKAPASSRAASPARSRARGEAGCRQAGCRQAGSSEANGGGRVDRNEGDDARHVDVDAAEDRVIVRHANAAHAEVGFGRRIGRRHWPDLTRPAPPIGPDGGPPSGRLSTSARTRFICSWPRLPATGWSRSSTSRCSSASVTPSTMDSRSAQPAAASSSPRSSSTCETARRLGVAEITLLGTEPMRRAADAAAIVHEAGVATGAPLHVLSHEEEAYLTLLGVTEGRPVERETLVVDIGGGSSEFAFVGPDRPAAAWGLQLGSARLTSRHVTHDPPAPDEVAGMLAEADEILAGATDAGPRDLVGVGGTASNLIKVIPAALLDRTLTRRRLADIQGILAAEPAELAAERHLINPVRARLLPAGGAIVAALLERYGLDRMRVSNASLREGAILAVHHAGSAWRDRLPDLAHGWRG